MLYLGEGDRHDASYNHMVKSTTFVEYKDSLSLISAGIRTGADGIIDDGYCNYRFLVYPTSEFERHYKSNDPYFYAAMVVVIFLFTSLVFAVYDIMVRRRQTKVMVSAKKTNDIVASLYPSNVRSRLFNDNIHNPPRSSKLLDDTTEIATSQQVEGGIPESHGRVSVYGSDPIADLFTSATVFFLDIAGFTAWSSEREPTQVRVPHTNERQYVTMKLPITHLSMLLFLLFCFLMLAKRFWLHYNRYFCSWRTYTMSLIKLPKIWVCLKSKPLAIAMWLWLVCHIQ
jgi:hypothetical protein